MNWYLYSRVRQPLSSQDNDDESHLLDRDLAVRILRLFVNLIELGDNDRVITSEEVSTLVESIMPDMFQEVNSTPNGVQRPRDSRINYVALRENLTQVLVSFILFLHHHCHIFLIFYSKF